MSSVLYTIKSLHLCLTATRMDLRLGMYYMSRGVHGGVRVRVRY